MQARFGSERTSGLSKEVCWRNGCMCSACQSALHSGITNPIGTREFSSLATANQAILVLPCVSFITDTNKLQTGASDLSAKH